MSCLGGEEAFQISGRFENDGRDGVGESRGKEHMRRSRRKEVEAKQILEEEFVEGCRLSSKQLLQRRRDMKTEKEHEVRRGRF